MKKLLLLVSCLSWAGCGFELPAIGTDKGDVAPRPIQYRNFQLAKAEPFSSCAQVDSYIATVNAEAEVLAEIERQKYMREKRVMAQAAVEDAATSAPTAGTAQGGDILTNIQEQGVDEADYIKVGKHHIFTLARGKLKVVARGSWKEVASLAQDDLSSPTLYADDDKIVVLGSKASRGGSYVVRIYKEDAEGIELTSEIEQQGAIQSTRLANHHLVVIARGELDRTTGQPALPSDVRCNEVIRPLVRDTDYAITKVSSIDLQNPTAEIKRVGLMGLSGHTYMTDKNIYVTKQVASPMFYEKNSENKEHTVIAKIHFDRDSGAIAYAASGGVKGRAKDVWAFKELTSGHLAVATTTGYLGGSGENEATNHLWIMGEEAEELSTVASVEDFGRREDIRSVRYVDQIAYIVTFEKTDPLFAIDLKDPHTPVMLDELKIPGFSMYMHPLKDNKMLGVGFDAKDQGDFSLYQGVKLSLFDVSDPKNLVETSHVILGKRGSISQVVYDHHAFFYDRESGLIGVPVNLLDGPSNDPWSYGGRSVFSGVIFYKVQGSDLVEVTRVSHKPLMSRDCARMMDSGTWWQSSLHADLDINRVLKVDGKYVLASVMGLSRGADVSTNMAELVKFDHAKESCPVTQPSYIRN